MPNFHRVRKVNLNEFGDRQFLFCSCGFWARVGLPCPHILLLVDEVSLSMVHVRCWKACHPCCNNGTPLGEALVRAQQEWLKVEGKGIPVTDEQLEKADFKKGQSSCPVFHENTTSMDHDDAMFVLNNGPCTHQDFKTSNFADVELRDDTTLSQVSTLMRGHEQHISHEATRMQKQVSEARREVFSKGDIEIDDARKRCIAAVDSVMKNSEFLSEKDVDEFVSSVEELSSELKKK